MRFTADTHAGVADGSITATVRWWTRPHAKVGGRYRVGPAVIEVDAVRKVALDAIDDADARRAGHTDVPQLRARLARTARRELTDDERVWWIEFHRVDAPAPTDVRDALAADAHVTAADRELIARKLDAIDRRSPHGAWTRAVLHLIADKPGVVSTSLAAELGRERADFKADVRKLKALGLTESLEVGYRLSPRGRAFLDGG